MLAAILTLCGMTLTSCSEKDLPVNNNPLAEKLEGIWYAKYDAEGTINDLYENYEAHYTYVVEIYKFDEDSISVWNRYFFDGDDEVPVTDLGGGSNGLGAFTYTSMADGTVVVMLSNTESAPEANRKDYLPLTRTLRLEGDKLSAKGVDGQDITIRPDNIGLEKMIDEWNTALHGGSGGLDHNPNDVLGPLGFNNSNWRSKETIYLYTGNGNDYVDAHRKYKKVALPWSTKDKEINFPHNFCDKITPENGWELVLNRCGYDGVENENYFLLYNKYTGILRTFYYMPSECGSGNDQFWQITMNGNMAYRTSMIYGIPMDKEVDNSKASVFGLTGMTANDELNAYVTPWTEKNILEDILVPRRGWWAFDMDLSRYRTDLNLSSGFIKFELHESKESNVSLMSNIVGNIDGTLDGSLDLKAQIKEGSKAAKVIGSICQVAKGVCDIGSAFANAATNPGAALSSLGAAFGDVTNICATFGQDKVTGYKGTLSANITLGLTAQAATAGVISSAEAIGAVASPTIPMKELDMKNTHFGQGVWNLKTSPKIYMTNAKMMFDKPKDYWGNAISGIHLGYSILGCVYFFDPSSIQVELNPNVFSSKDIEWMKVDAICGARITDSWESIDDYRSALKLTSRYLTSPENYYGIYHINPTNESYTNNDILTDFFYNESDKNGLTYPVVGTVATINKANWSYYGRGKENSYMLEPQIATSSQQNFCVAPPVVVDVVISVKLKSRDEVFVFNGNFLPEIEYVEATQDKLTGLYNSMKDRTPSYVKNYDVQYHKTYDYHMNRTYDKIKYLFPDANISK